MKPAIEYREPPEAPPPEPPRRKGLWSEWRLVPGLVRLGLASLELRRLPRGDGSVVLLIPGFKGPEATMGPLRRYLARIGHDARHWGFGVNRGDPERDCERLAPKVTRLASETGRPVRLVGWSLGGVIARETARMIPGSVDHVLTFGTPAIGGPTYTLAAAHWGRRECERIARLAEELDRSSPIPVPITAIFSRADEVVAWPSCIDRASPRVRHFEVASTHIGMIVDPAVWEVIARRMTRK